MKKTKSFFKTFFSTLLICVAFFMGLAGGIRTADYLISVSPWLALLVAIVLFSALVAIAYTFVKDY